MAEIADTQKPIVITGTWREIEEKVRRILLSVDDKNFRTISVQVKDGSGWTISSLQDLSNFVKQVRGFAKEDEAESAASVPLYKPVLFGWGAKR
jgi:hypothetical protein